MQPTGAPNLQTAKTSSLRSSRGSNLHCVPVLADRARSCAQNVHNCGHTFRPSPQEKQAARLRPARKLLARDASHGQDTAIRREALPIAAGKSISIARLRPMQDVSIIRETGQLLVAPLIFRCIAFRSRALHSQNWPASLRKPSLSETPSLDFTACCLGCHAPISRPSFRSVPAPGTQRNWHCAGATVPVGRDAVTDPAKFWSGFAHGVGMTERRRLRCSCLRAWAASLLPGHSHNTYCA